MPLLVQDWAQDFGGNKHEPVPALSDSPSSGERKTRKTRFLEGNVRARDVLRKDTGTWSVTEEGIFSAVDVLARRRRSGERPRPGAEPGVLDQGCWRQEHRAGD